MVGMFQKEMAVRIAAKPNSKDYGVIGILAQAYYDCEYYFDVPPGCFTPPPKVMKWNLTDETQKHSIRM